MQPNFIPKQVNYLSKNHIYSAALFAVNAKEYEDKNKNNTLDHRIAGELFYDKYISYVTGSIIFSVSFLEAVINEAYELIHIEVDENFAESFLNINMEIRDNISKLWKSEFWNNGTPKTAKKPLLDKYDLLLVNVKNKKLNKGDHICQNISTLIKLRNYLIHYIPEQIEVPSSYNNKVTVEKLGKELQNKGYLLNPLVHPHEPVFPYKCLSYGCSRWAIISSINFADYFYNTLGLIDFFKEPIQKISELGFEMD